MAKETRYDLIGIGNNVRLGKKGPRIRNESGVIEHRNNADNAFAKVRGDHPTDPNDFVTLKYLQTRASVVVSGQINGGSPPAAGTVGRIFICTTAGGGYNLTSLYYDDGAAWEEIVPTDGMVIKITQDLTGGTNTYTGEHLYMWDATGGTWVDLGISPGDAEGVKAKTVTLDYTDAGVNLIKQLPAGSRALQTKINVTQAFNGTNPTAIIGDVTDPDRHAAADENDLEEVGLYSTEVDYYYGGATNVNVTISATGATQGQASVKIMYELT